MEEFEEMMECCICTNRYTQPRILSCIHTFCLDCLETFAVQQELKSGDTMQCPICRKPFFIPKEGMATLQKNVFMERLIEISKSSKRSSYAVPCDKCKKFRVCDVKEIPNAAQFCIQCQQNICNQCCQDHERFGELQNHQFVDIRNQQDEELVKKVTVQYCHQHNENKSEVFCADCQQVICIICFIQEHKFHNCSGIGKVAEQLRNQICSDLDKIKSFEADAASKIQEVAAMQSDFQKTIEDTEKAIIDRGNEMKKLVDMQTRCLLDELAMIRHRESKRMACAKEESETHKMEIESLARSCMELKNKGSDAEVCRSANDIRLRAEELLEVHEKQVRQIFASTKVYLELSNLEDLLKEDNILGRIREVSTQLSGKLEITKSSTVCGVTKLENRIYVLCGCPSVILVFDDECPFTNQEQIEIEEIDNPVDIEHCKTSNCLYVLEWSNYCIWKISTDGHRLTKWLNTSSCRPIAPNLSVNSEGQLLILSFDHEYGDPSLDTYGPDAKLLRCLPIELDIRPTHVIEKPNRDIIVSHRLQGDVGERCAISRLSSDGKSVLGQFTPKNNSEALKEARRFAMDISNDWLFVADFWKDRVVLFDANSLRLLQILLTHDICRPRSLFYDDKKQQLIIGQGNAEVYIYEVN